MQSDTCQARTFRSSLPSDGLKPGDDIRILSWNLKDEIMTQLA